MPNCLPPPLNIPPSHSTVSISAINTTSQIHNVQSSLFITPPIPGLTYLPAPIYCFLIHHPASNTHLLFDLGIRKDFHNLSPNIYSRIKNLNWNLTVEKDVPTTLEENGMSLNTIDGVIWSHSHFDHTGDMSLFHSKTKLIVGRGFMREMMPGYPSDLESEILESDYKGREVVQVDFEKAGLKIGRFDAVDWFNDGSFYLLDSPGHAVGHLCALGRVGENKFVFLAGDAFHYPGEIRPSKWLSIPEDIQPSPFGGSGSCPGRIFDQILKREGREEGKAFYSPARVEKKEESFHLNVDELVKTVEKIQEMDCQGNVLVCAAHDESLLMGGIELFPEGKLDGFWEKGWIEKVRWRFLRDFGKSVGRECEGEDGKYPNEKWAA
ncbi:beta-lactamase-like protein [Podospora fimiseda]|uniref:Beta-lactamase-like protein n=1 Tax=Podospora fimiseda TaxID=252190 RepID=A0AAN7GWV1_9PEZI|nr:beta-lactamase-like protein [Podospora fimiseda]